MFGSGVPAPEPTAFGVPAPRAVFNESLVNIA